MAFTEKIRVLIDVVTDGANTQLGKFRTAVQQADTTTGKFKAGASAAFDSVKANAGVLALGAGTALVGFGVKAVGVFQDTALGAGQLRDALGLTAEEASRLAEVAGDIGIDVGALEKTIGRMNREAENSPGRFDAIGAAIARNKDGTVNVNETFLSTIDALNKIPDATTRAAKAQEIFGRSWQDIAELVGLGADEVRKRLGEVSDQKIIDEEEIEKARRLRESLDNLKDVLDDVMLAVGEMVVGPLSDFADGVLAVKNAIDKVTGILPDWFDPKWFLGPIALGQELKGVVEDVADAVGVTGKDGIDEFGDAIEGMNSVLELGITKMAELEAATDKGNLAQQAATVAADLQAEAQAKLRGRLHDTEIRQQGMANTSRLAREATERFREKSAQLAEELANVTTNLDRLLGRLSDEQAYLNAVDGFESVRVAAEEAYAAAAEGSEDAESKARDHRQALLDLAQETAAYLDQLGDIPEATTTRIVALIDKGMLDDAERQLAILARNRDVFYNPRGAPGYSALPKFHSGGVVPGPRGQEVPIMAQGGETVIPPGSGLTGTVVNVTVNAGLGTDGRLVGAQIVEELRKYEQFNGPSWRN
jgi:hypothetical protein